jgi:maltose O-acetyltransferase
VIKMKRRIKRWWPDVASLPARFAALPVVPLPLRMRILATRGHRFAPRARIRTGTLVTGRNLTLGFDVFVNGDCYIDAHAPVEVGDRAGIGQRSVILTEDHDLGPPERRFGEMFDRGVTIGAGAWIGAGVVILPGTAVGDGAVVAAGAVARGTLEPNTLYAGVPAKAIRELGS